MHGTESEPAVLPECPEPQFELRMGGGPEWGGAEPLVGAFVSPLLYLLLHDPSLLLQNG